jgi:hypothetical protein
VKRFRPTCFEMIGDGKCIIREISNGQWIAGTYRGNDWFYWSDRGLVEWIVDATKFATPEEAESVFLGEAGETESMMRSIER